MKSNNLKRSFVAVFMIGFISLISYQSLDFLTSRPQKQPMVLGVTTTEVRKTTTVAKTSQPASTAITANSNITCGLIKQYLATHCTTKVQPTTANKADPTIPCSEFSSIIKKYCPETARPTVSKPSVTPSPKLTCTDGQLKCVSKYQFICQNHDWKYQGTCPGTDVGGTRR